MGPVGAYATAAARETPRRDAMAIDAKPAVVFLHGIGGSARSWTLQLTSCAAAGYRPVALDAPGYGARAPVTVMNFDDLAADLEATLDARGLDRPVLVGHSMGGMIAQTALRRRP